MKTRHYIYILALLVLCLQRLAAGHGDFRERVYVQTDKQHYLAGESLWLKLYLTDATGKPSSFSKIGYIELLDEHSAQVQIKLDITNGTAQGWMDLPANLPTGYYRLTAYTRYMQNEGEEVFFQKLIGIINTFKTDETIRTDSTLQATSPSVLDNNLSITTERQTLSLRSQSEFRIQGLPDNVHSLSVSVAGADMLPTTNAININQWHNQLSDKPRLPLKTEFIPEYEGHIVKGKLINISTETLGTNESVSPLLGFTGDQVRLFGGQIQKEDVLFYTTHIQGMHELATATYSASNNQYRVDITSPFAAHSEKQLPLLTLNPAWGEQLMDRSMGLQVLYTYTADSLSKTDTTYAHFQWKPDRSYLLDEYTRFTTMEEVIIEFIPTLRFRKINNQRLLSVLNEERSGFTIGNSLVLVDGVPVTDHESIFRYDPFLVRKIDVYRGKFVFGGQFYDGLIFFTTYNLNYPGLKVGETTQTFDYEGTQAHRRFYAPSYTDSQVKNNRIPDYRHTLLWMPEIPTEGKSTISVPFSTSDIPGQYQITVEGITTDGEIIRGTSFFQVE
ncbi:MULTISPECIES: hypothetical protein [unclassified Parabacteroides]|uniref:hypothetical protein n=1 Tax=unclassified Parabacteroides TaxID=2649774 RepID=UPI002476122D|nr:MULTISPECIES: hypothetical protein [unclassified Parabacteroides]MDH6346586.1 hypothetical protein [Parabacteroides sp. PH5-46]MDH6377215.1 hypothetical protein [Parabacteroides sp. PH5-33]